jgi:hypothetical protein
VHRPCARKCSQEIHEIGKKDSRGKEEEEDKLIAREISAHNACQTVMREDRILCRSLGGGGALARSPLSCPGEGA